MDKSIHDIGRTRVRSSRPNPPFEWEEEWQELLTPENGSDPGKKGGEQGEGPAESRH